MPNFQVEQLRRLPRRANETWQGGWARLPSWIEEAGQEPYRPWAPLWVSVRTGTVGAIETYRTDQRDFAKALATLVQFACDRKCAGHRPGRIEVNDSALAEHLSGMLAETGIQVVPREELPAVDRCLSDMAECMTGQPPAPGALEGAGVTLERMRRFARAARAFDEAAPWEELSDEDLIRIEAPSTQKGLGFVTVLGGSGQTYGLGFFRSDEDYWRFLESSTDPDAFIAGADSGIWSLQFADIVGLPLADADLWEDHDLPVAGEDAFPVAACYGGIAEIRRPDAQTLSFMEGLLQALAATTETEMDGGRWTRHVETAEGTVGFALALPDLLDPPAHQDLFRRGIMPDRRAMERMSAQMDRYFADHPAASIDEMNEVIQREFTGKTLDEIQYTPRTPLEEAQDLCYQAFDARGRRQVQLAKEAIQVCPDCADAYVILAEQTSDPKRGRDLYAKAVEAGEKALGKDRFERDGGHFWGMTDTRPYMRARFGLAQCLDAIGHAEEAIDHYQALLCLNPADNQGVRFILVPRLIQLGRDAEGVMSSRQVFSACSASSSSRASVRFFTT